MPVSSNVINVPKPAPGSYDTKRPAGALLRAQTMHLREGLIRHLAEVAAIIAEDPRSLRTEGDVSAYVKKATAILHPHPAVPSGN
jgi:hypothetical protein